MPLSDTETVTLATEREASQAVTLARMEARLAGMSRELTSLREDMARLTAQQEIDHRFLVHLADLLYAAAIDTATAEKVW